MKKLFRYSQQIITGLVLLVAAGGVAFAGPSFDITTLISGFIRYTNGHPDPVEHPPGRFYYGYGWSGNLQEWGYGYGYTGKPCGELLAGPAEECYIDEANYGFDGTEGSVSIENVDTTQTTATITYSTNYLAKVVRGYSLDGITPIVVEVEDTFNSGTRIWNISGLTCGTIYQFGFSPIDAGGNVWESQSSFTTSSCNRSHQTISGSVFSPVTTHNPGSHNPQGLKLPSITLALGSLGVDVQDLQILLNHFGTFLATNGAGSPGEETEFFGRRTFNALKNFQKTFGLNKVDGVYGPETQGVMESFLK